MTVEQIAELMWRLDLFTDEQVHAFLAAHQGRY